MHLSWSLKEIKKEFLFLCHIANSGRQFRWTAFKLSLSIFLYQLRGITRCPYHGYSKQSFWTGYCSECGEIPKLPPMDEICAFCGEEKAVLQRASPNDDKEIWSLCWECDKYIDWAQERSWYLQAESMGIKGKMVEPWEDWLFNREQVYPKRSGTIIELKKMK